MAEQTQKDFDALRKDMQNLRADLDALTQSLRELAGERLDRARAGAREAGERAQQQARELRDSVGDQIEERPFTSLFTAFGIGMILGALFGRKG